MGLTIVNLTHFHYGLCPNKKALPSGWHFEENPVDFLMAVSPDGRRWWWDGQDALHEYLGTGQAGNMTSVGAVEMHEV